MNFKQLFPTYRRRYTFVSDSLSKYVGDTSVSYGLHLGTGEGDYDSLILKRCSKLTACDINENDIEFARERNAQYQELDYKVEDALNLTFPSNTFDLIISIDVIEHVGNPEKMLAEMSRVITEGGLVIVTYPQSQYPWTYDPINKLLELLSIKNLSIGAFGYGHNCLIENEKFRAWAKVHGFRIIEEHQLSSYLIGVMEMYWPGIIQKYLKHNSSNLSDGTSKKTVLRPGVKEPKLAVLTDILNKVDNLLFRKSKSSIGKGFVLKKVSDG